MKQMKYTISIFKLERVVGNTLVISITWTSWKERERRNEYREIQVVKRKAVSMLVWQPLNHSLPLQLKLR